MARIRLIHWNPDEAAAHARTIRALGHSVACEQLTPDTSRRIKDHPPDLFVICLDRMPGQGRDVAGAFAEYKSTRVVPVLFVGGLAEKVAKIRKSVHNGNFTSWTGLGPAIGKALRNPPDPAHPDSRFAGYSGTPLPKKLGIKEGSAVAVMGGPEDFAATLGSLPEGAFLHARPRGKRNLTIWFLRSLKELEKAIPGMVEASRQGPVWMAWAKKTSPLAADVGEKDVRALGLAAGLVDYKICAIDQNWSGLLFALRKK